MYRAAIHTRAHYIPSLVSSSLHNNVKMLLVHSVRQWLVCAQVPLDSIPVMCVCVVHVHVWEQDKTTMHAIHILTQTDSLCSGDVTCSPMILLEFHPFWNVHYFEWKFLHSQPPVMSGSAQMDCFCTNSIVHYTAAQITVVVTLWLNASTISWRYYRKEISPNVHIVWLFMVRVTGVCVCVCVCVCVHACVRAYFELKSNPGWWSWEFLAHH